MRWATQAFVVFSLMCSALSADSGTPSLKIMARSSVYNVAEKKGIYCEGTNVPDQIEWISPTGEVVQGRSAKNTRVYVERRNAEPNLVALIIHSTKLSDAGNWTCKAGDISETIEIIVGEKVVLTPNTEEVHSDEGKTIRLNCEAKGTPKPSVQWYKENFDITEEPRYVQHTKDDNHQLEIRRLTHEDAGNYTCKVTQNTLSHYTHKTIHLHVHHKPILFNPETNDVYVLEAGRKFKTEEIYAAVNDTKNITCSALAYPPAKFSWYRRKGTYDQPIRDQDSISQDNPHSSTLMLNVYDENDLGEYKCTATNVKGSISVIYHVNQAEKPLPPENITQHSHNSTHITFNITCGENCTFGEDSTETLQPDNLPIIAYSFQLVPVEEEYPPDWDNNTLTFTVQIRDPEDTLFEVGPLPKKTKFHVRVRAQNLAGFSDWLEWPGGPNPETDSALRLASSLCLVAVTYFITMCN